MPERETPGSHWGCHCWLLNSLPLRTMRLLETGGGGSSVLQLSSHSLLFGCSVVSDSCNPLDCSPPGSSVHGISQARTLGWVAISFSRGSSRLKDGTCVFCLSRWILYHWATGALNISQSLSSSPVQQGLFNLPRAPHCITFWGVLILECPYFYHLKLYKNHYWVIISNKVSLESVLLSTVCFHILVLLECQQILRQVGRECYAYFITEKTMVQRSYLIHLARISYLIGGELRRIWQ